MAFRTIGEAGKAGLFSEQCSQGTEATLVLEGLIEYMVICFSLS